MPLQDKNAKWTGETAQSDPNQLPQATNDVVSGVSEDATGAAAHVISIATLLGNDKGGEAKAFYGADTLSAEGADITVSADGLSILYNTNGKFEALAAGTPDTDTFNYTIKLANGATSTAQVTVNLTGVNDAPTAVNDTASTNEDTATTINVRLNDSDIDGGTLSIPSLSSATSTKGAAISVNSDGNIVYDSTGSTELQALNTGQSTTDTFSYAVSDGQGGTSTATATVNVAGVNDQTQGTMTFGTEGSYPLSYSENGLTVTSHFGDGTSGHLHLEQWDSDSGMELFNHDGGCCSDPYVFAKTGGGEFSLTSMTALQGEGTFIAYNAAGGEIGRQYVNSTGNIAFDQSFQNVASVKWDTTNGQTIDDLVFTA